MTTNIVPNQQHFDNAVTEIYDRDIEAVVPHHGELHNNIRNLIKRHLNPKAYYSLLELGVGSGLTAHTFQALLPNANLDVVDFSQQMLSGAKKRLGRNVNYI